MIRTLCLTTRGRCHFVVSLRAEIEARQATGEEDPEAVSVG